MTKQALASPTPVRDHIHQLASQTTSFMSRPPVTMSPTHMHACRIAKPISMKQNVYFYNWSVPKFWTVTKGAPCLANISTKSVSSSV